MTVRAIQHHLSKAWPSWDHKQWELHSFAIIFLIAIFFKRKNDTPEQQLYHSQWTLFLVIFAISFNHNKFWSYESLWTRGIMNHLLMNPSEPRASASFSSYQPKQISLNITKITSCTTDGSLQPRRHNFIFVLEYTPRVAHFWEETYHLTSTQQAITESIRRTRWQLKATFEATDLPCSVCLAGYLVYTASMWFLFYFRSCVAIC